MKTGFRYSLLAAPALLALAACDNPDGGEAPDVTVDDAAPKGAAVDEPMGDEIDAEALPPDYPPTPSVDPAEPATDDADTATPPDESMGTDEPAPNGGADPES